MSRRTVTAASAVLIAAFGVLITLGCASRLSEWPVASAPSRTAQAPLLQRIVQLRDGSNLRFAQCVVHECPSVTPKTVAAIAPLPVAAQPAPRIIEPPAASAAATPASSPSHVEPRERQITVHFHTGKATLTTAGRLSLRSSIALARKSDRIVIRGRTDSLGNDALNEALAFARAMAVRDYIRSQAPDLPNVIAISARGNCCFVADNDTEAGRLQNRRVEVVFSLRSEART